jgi:hypothetical protein
MGKHPVSIDHTHEEIHEGNQYSFDEVITLASAATQDYFLQTPDTNKVIHFGYAVEGIFGITLELFEATDKAGTSAQTPINRNRNSTNTAGLIVKKGTSGGTTDGAKIGWKKSGSGTAQGRLAGQAGSGLERVLKQNTKYIFRVTSAANSNDVSVQLDWYEART